MSKTVIIGSNNLDLLRQLIARESNLSPEFKKSVDKNLDNEIEEDLLEDEDLRQIVQIRLRDFISDESPIIGLTLTSWADTNIAPESLEEYRNNYPEHEYRLVAVYDEIVDEIESVDQQDISPEDEIGLLKAEVLNLKAQLAQYEAQESF